MAFNDPTDLYALDNAQLDAAERAQQAAQLETDDLKWLMSNKRGRRFVYRLLERAGVWRLSFNTNALTMAFNEGTRNEGLWLLAQITLHCPDRHAEMLKEQKQ